MCKIFEQPSGNFKIESNSSFHVKDSTDVDIFLDSSGTEQLFSNKSVQQ